MRIVVVEDDPNSNRQLVNALKGAGEVVDSALDGEQGLFLGDMSEPDMVVLDLGLPTMDGMDVLRRWRASGKTMPVLILTARDMRSDKVEGIDSGADDYVVKPFHVAQLLARIRALFRLSAGRASPVLSCGPITFDTRTSVLMRGTETGSLTAYEQCLLHFPMLRAACIVPCTEIMEHIYAQDFDRDSNTIEVFVRRLRQKLGVDVIEAVRGQVYRMRAHGGVEPG